MLPALKNGPYNEKALVPKSPWIKAVPLQTPTLFIADNGSFAQTSWSTKMQQTFSSGCFSLSTTEYGRQKF